MVDIPAYISAGAAVVAAISAMAATIRSYQNGQLANKMRADIAQVHILINSRVDQLLISTAAQARQEGEEMGRKQLLGDTRHIDLMNAIHHESGSE